MNNLGIRTLNYAFGFVVSFFAFLCVRSDWQRLSDGIKTKMRVLGPKLNDDLGHLPAALVVCEDIRFFEHRGVDLYSIFRASIRFVRGRSVEGASTITQQLVRVYTDDYHFSLRRKVREILLATLVDLHFSKQDQIRLYLHKAYFGWRMNGLTQAAGRLMYPAPYAIEHAAEIAARLKYPEPEFPSPQRQRQITCRAAFIMGMLEKLRNTYGNSKTL